VLDTLDGAVGLALEAEALVIRHDNQPVDRGSGYERFDSCLRFVLVERLMTVIK
jgi:hypothetical protein